ncbi:hypothetical protein [Acidovorax sp. Leaf78]|uniref:hypothetical protein n=1 Tax=Acidovorax sp. Leaf78 TaxID=1736237 RepID=UPI0006F8F1BC|nr:hypothetical protein [Acidovorax sp. Leaf78]KQO26023.1 hypothetical protein ASF16_19955 [Acidovorax sp. Leaf78]
MNPSPDHHKILAFAVFELRMLLAGQLGPTADGDPSVRAAAHLAYALHNQALAVLAGKSFDTALAIEAIAKVDKMFGENFVQQFSAATATATSPVAEQ